MIVEILCDGVVHYRRPVGHKDVEEARNLMKKGNTLYLLRYVPDGVD